MQFFIGITPPEALQKKIISFQRSFINNNVPDKVEPHITIKSQGGLTEDKAWLPKIESSLKNRRTFRVSFEGVGHFEENVIFLKPTFSQDLVSLHKTLLDTIGPYKDPTNKYFENDRYHPHLTLGGMSWGLTKEEAIEMKKSAKRELSHLAEFEVNSIRIYQKSMESKSWHKLADVPFEIKPPPTGSRRN